MSEGGGGSVLALCEHPDEDRIVKGSIPSLIIDKHKEEGCEWGSQRKADSCGVNACNHISWGKQSTLRLTFRIPHAPHDPNVPLCVWVCARVSVFGSCFHPQKHQPHQADTCEDAVGSSAGAWNGAPLTILKKDEGSVCRLFKQNHQLLRASPSRQREHAAAVMRAFCSCQQILQGWDVIWI